MCAMRGLRHPGVQSMTLVSTGSDISSLHRLGDGEGIGGGDSIARLSLLETFIDYYEKQRKKEQF